MEQLTAEKDAALKAGLLGVRDGQALERGRIAVCIGVEAALLALLSDAESSDNIALLEVISDGLSRRINAIRGRMDA